MRHLPLCATYSVFRRPVESTVESGPVHALAPRIWLLGPDSCSVSALACSIASSFMVVMVTSPLNGKHQLFARSAGPEADLYTTNECTPKATAMQTNSTPTTPA